MKKFLSSFFRFQVSSFIATIVDFGVTILLKEIFGIHYLISTSVGSLTGGVTNFYLGRRWVFRVREFSHGRQAVRYLIGWAGSILLNIFGVFMLTQFGNINYIYSKIIVSLFVGIFFNYLFQRKFVFSISREIRRNSLI